MYMFCDILILSYYGSSVQIAYHLNLLHASRFCLSISLFKDKLFIAHIIANQMVQYFAETLNVVFQGLFMYPCTDVIHSIFASEARNVVGFR